MNGDTPQTGQAAPAGGASQGAQDGSQISSEQMQQLMKLLQPHKELTQPQVNPKAATTGLGMDIGVGLLSSFVPFLGQAIKKHAMVQKQAQVNEAFSDFKQLHDSLEEAWIMSGGDQQKALQLWEQMPGYKDIFDPANPASKKKLKNYAKVFQVDWLNPDKVKATTQYQGLQKFMEAYPKSKMVKALHQKMTGQGAQQMQQGAQSFAGENNVPGSTKTGSEAAWRPGQGQRLPMHMTPPDVKGQETLALASKNLIEAQYASEPKGEFQAWYRAKKDENKGKPVTSAQIEAHYEHIRLKPVDDVVQQGIDLAQQGDIEGAKKMFDLAQEAAISKKGAPKKNRIDLIIGANKGNKEDIAALNKLQALDIEQKEAYGKGRAKYAFLPYVFPDGTIRPMSGLEMFNWITDHPGEQPPVPSGKLTSNQIISVQQLIRESGPVGTPSYQTGALKGMYDHISAFDNAKDRAIFAKAWNNAEHSSDWLATMHNVINQVAVDELSPMGKLLWADQKRLAETMGRFRSSMGLPSTDQSMNLSLALIPGTQTPNSAMARQLLDNLSVMIENAQVPAFGPVPGGDKKKSGEGFDTDPAKPKKSLQQIIKEAHDAAAGQK